MNQTDDRILELLDESGLELTPSVIAKNLNYSRSWASRRVSKLIEHNLIIQTDNNYYKISQKGQEYLSGDITAEEIKAKE